MTKAMFGKDSVNFGRSQIHGADLISGGWEELTVDRMDGPPLSFIGCRVSRHWRQFHGGRVLSICLWRRQKSGFVVGFSTWSHNAVRDVSVAVDSLAEAITFLEDFCTDQSSHHAAGPLYESLWQMQQSLVFTQSFGFLVGEALATWTDLDPATGDARTRYRVKA